MTTAGTPAQSLAACAVLYHFNHESLQVILNLADHEISAILAHPAVEAITTAPDRYQLKPERRPNLIRQLRRSLPHTEYDLHRRAFAYSLKLLAASGPRADRRELRAAAMHHLRAIYHLNLHYMRWEEMETLIAAWRDAAPDGEAADRHQVALYEAYLAQRRQNYRRCAELVASVLQAGAISAELRAEALLTRGLSAWSQAQLEAAQADFATVLAITADGQADGIRGRALINQSWICNQLYQFAEALALSQQSLEAFKRAEDRYSMAFALYSIGNNSLYLGEWELGRRCLQQAGTIYRSAKMVARLATVDWGRGFLHQMLGNHERSKRAYLRALRVAESSEHSNAVTAADTLFELGLVYQVQNRLARAENALRRAITITERLGDELNHALLLHRYSRILAEIDPVAALHELGAAIDKLEQLRVSTQSEDLKIGLLGTAQQVYETMILAQVSRGDVASAFAYVERARARAFLDLLAGRGELQDVSEIGRPVDLAGLQTSLAPGSLVLEFFTVGLLPPGGEGLARIPTTNRQLRDQLLTRPAILLFAIGADTVELHMLAIDPNTFMPPPGDPAPGWHLMTERKLRWFYEKLIAPVAHLLADCRVLHLIPHGPLHYLPFAALPTPSGDTLLRSGGQALSYAPSATLLVRSLHQTPSTGDHALALGYDDRGSTALLLAEREARQISRFASGAALIGAANKSAQLIARAEHIRWLHIAGHAVYRPDDPLGSFLRLGAADDLSARTIMASLNLPGSLVTINACASGLSRVTSGDELLGLPRAFLYAGAATIICTLHQIDDLAAYTLMVCFAENLALGATPSEALRSAQLQLRAANRAEIAGRLAHSLVGDERVSSVMLESYDEIPFAHPRYWAPFILIGQP
ncbi:MAG: CHAT domain-containing protein [Oscillochloris sp.]|nr:CHAT domain-containing protein [Oscillochloris sp.]